MSWITDYQRWLSETESLNNAQKVADHFAASWSKEAIAALCGNMRHESSLNPDMYEYGYAWSQDRGYGLVQWTPRSKYWNWATAQGLPPREGDSQLARIDYEVEQNIQWIAIARYGGMTFKQFRENAGGWSVDYLTEAFTWCYERPNATAGENSMPARKAFAGRVFNELSFEGGTGGKPAWPTTDGLLITSPYGWRTHPISGELAFHHGIDIGGNQQAQPIYATQDGKVILNSWHDISGWRVRLEHTGDQYFSQYIHLASQSPLPVGTVVKKGDHIGTMGTTGDSTGIHLDFSIAISATGFHSETGTIDPEEYLKMSFGGGGGSPSPSRPTGGVAAISPPTQYKYEKEGTLKLMTYYEVKPGDTLSQIAAKHNVPMAAIQRVRFQPIVNANALSKGEVLLLPKAVKSGVKQPAATPKTHVVKAGETLSGIAKKYNTSVGRLAMNNRIGDPNKIKVGQRIDIYG